MHTFNSTLLDKLTGYVNEMIALLKGIFELTFFFVDFFEFLSGKKIIKKLFLDVETVSIALISLILNLTTCLFVPYNSLPPPSPLLTGNLRRKFIVTFHIATLYAVVLERRKLCDIKCVAFKWSDKLVGNVHRSLVIMHI